MIQTHSRIESSLTLRVGEFAHTAYRSIRLHCVSTGSLRIGELALTLRKGGAVASDKRPLKEAGYLLANCPLFDDLSPDERGAVGALARIKTFSAGEIVFAIGSPGDQMMALLSGTIRISVPSSGGKELLLAMIKPGEVFGELAVLDGKERSADAVAETACTVAILDRRDILSFFERNPSAWPGLVRLLCQRLRHTDQVFAEVAMLELPVRLAKTMLRVLSWAADSAAAEPAKIHFSQRELANMVGGSRESVNKCLSNWQRTGVVRISGGSIIISDRRALENIAGPA
jgi:CRP/FNR family transcriptional regulator, cyclic AMP receptor protein